MEHDDGKQRRESSGKQEQAGERELPASIESTPGAGGQASAVPYMEQFFGSETGELTPLRELLPAAMDETAAGIVEALDAEAPEAVLEQAPAGDEDMTGEPEGQSVSEEQPELEEEPAMEADELNRVIEEICRSKAAEFRMLGYEQVTGKEIWECVSDKYGKTGIPPIHRIVNDILSLKVTQFMNWMTMSIYKDAHFR